MAINQSEQLFLEVHDTPTFAFATSAVSIAEQAWADQIISGEESVDRLFNPQDAEQLFAEMKRANGVLGRWVGVLAIADDAETRGVVGYGWSTETYGASHAARIGRAVAHKIGWPNTEPEVHVNQLNTLPRYQRRGVGHAVLGQLMREHDGDRAVSVQTPSGFLYPHTWFKRAGFKPDEQTVESQESLRLTSRVEKIREHVRLRPSIADGIWRT